MSVICQTFVQNAWKKDLCSNCFKSKEEHGRGRGGGTHMGLRGGYLDKDSGNLTQNGPTRGLDGNVGGGSKRYMGVAGSVYQRSYYNRNSWKSMMLDHSDSGLKSPGLIKGMSNLVTHENEKNLKLSDMMDSDNRGDSLRSSRLVQHVKTSQSEAKLLSELLDDGLGSDRLPSEKKRESDKPYIEDKGDVSSDLGSEASNDISSTSSAASSSFYEVAGSAANSDTTSVKSDAGSEQYEGEKEEYIERDSKEMNGSDLVKDRQEQAHKINSILKKAGDPKGTRGSICFRTTLEEVIGYGGDVDYSDDEDMFDDDDDDDDFDDFMDLTPDERVLRRLTEKNTDFNSDNDNLKKDIEELLPSVKELEEKRKMIIAEIEELERLGRENRSKTYKTKLEELQQPPDDKKEEKPEGKVKLKRSPPLVTIKPLIARNNNEVRVNQVLPMKNGEIIRPLISSEIEEIPLKGIKPKYVSREDEMVEKVCDDESKVNSGKVTSIDDFCLPETTTTKKGKVTSIDDICVPVIDNSVRSGELVKDEASALTRIDNLLSKQESHIATESTVTDEKKDESLDIKTHPSVSVTPTVSPEKRAPKTSPRDKKESDKANSSQTKTQKLNNQEIEQPKSSVKSCNAKSGKHESDAKKPEKIPLSSTRKSVNSSSQEDKEKCSVKESSQVVKSSISKEVVQQKESESPKESVVKAPSCTQLKEQDRNVQKDPGECNTPPVSSEINKKDDNQDEITNEQVVAQQQSPSNNKSQGNTLATKRLSLNHEILEIQTAKEPLKKCKSTPDEKLYTSQSEVEVPKTPENSNKIPASRQGSTSSLFTTFGTPVVVGSTSQNSFLHSPASRSVFDDGNSASSTYSPATTDFLKEIKSHPEAPVPTAGIQKSALYASTSCLKGLPGAKPVITPKPPILKEKPKVPLKPCGSTSRIYATPSPVSGNSPTFNLSGAVSTPNLHGSIEGKNSAVSDASSTSRLEQVPESVYKIPTDQKKPPPTTQAPAIPVSLESQKNEVVYDIPVTIASSQPSNTACTSSKSSPKDTMKVDDATIYHEIDDSIKSKVLTEVSAERTTNDTENLVYSPNSIARVESTRCQSRSTFEANRSLLSAALDFGCKSLKSSDNKRTAPPLPADDGAGDDKVLDAVISMPDLSPEAAENLQNESVGVYEGQAPVQIQSLPPHVDNDRESYSSFTDDFDDEDEEEEEQSKVSLRKAERSSSAIPFYRNSVGPILTHDLEDSTTIDPKGDSLGQDLAPGWDYGSGIGFNKPVSSRSHSVPRVAEHIITREPSPPPATSFSSKFSFGRSGFFRPSSPPTLKRNGGKSSSDRGRDRTKKTSSSSSSSSSSKFSLKKLLRFGSKDDEKRSQKEQEKRNLRESKKGKLQIIHPLDYNQNGVEVIARPEKTSPIYDYSGIYGYIPPPRMSSKVEDVYNAVVSAASQVPPVQASPAPSLSSKRSENSVESGQNHSATSGGDLNSATAAYAVSSPITSSSSASGPTSVCSATVSAYNANNIYAPVPITSTAASSTSTLEKKSSFLRKDSHLDRCESNASQSSNTIYSQSSVTATTPSHHSHPHLGFNSEGRPRPPPPPRKVSLESSQANEIYSSVAELMTPKRPPSDSSTPTEAPSRPQRPPPPTRTLSNAGAGSKSGPPRPEPPKLGRDSVYANLGDVRAPITPRKPGRSASIRGDEDREKRRAPQPPHGPQLPQDVAQQIAAQRTIRHQHQDSTSSSCSSLSSTTRASKGPAPPRPQQPQGNNNDYETYERDSASASNITQIAVGSTTSTVVKTSRLDEVYQVPQNNSQTADPSSAPSLRQEKTGRLSVRRGSAVTHRSLEDQYGAVISANLEALSNMLDQLSNNCCPPGYEEVSRRVRKWEDISMDDDIIVGAGHRLFYAGSAFGKEITLMLTPESKVDAHHLLTPMPISTFKDQIPTHLLSHKTIMRGKTTQGTVWVLPPLSLTTLRTLADESHPALLAAPLEWERQTCLLLLQYITGLKQLQAQGVEETCIDLTLASRGSEEKGHDPDPRVMLVPPMETGIPVMSLCKCAAVTTLMLMGIETTEDSKNTSLPSSVPSQRAFRTLLQLLHQEKAGSLTQAKCILEVLLFGPDNFGSEDKTPDEIEAGLQRWLDLERATVLHTLIRGPLESSVLTKYHLLFLVRTNSKVLRETMKLLEESEETSL